MGRLQCLPVLQTGDMGTISFSYSNGYSNRAHSYDHALAKADTSAGAGYCCSMYFMNSWVLALMGWSLNLWSQMKLSVWPDITNYYLTCQYLLLPYYITLWLHYYYIIITSLQLLHIVLLHCYYIILLLLHTYYYLLIPSHYMHYYIIITSLLHHHYSLSHHYYQLRKQVIMSSRSSLWHIMHFPGFHYYIVITHDYYYFPFLHVTNWATCRWACWHFFSIATVLAVKFGSNQFRIMPEIVSKLWHIPSGVAVLLNWNLYRSPFLGQVVHLDLGSTALHSLISCECSNIEPSNESCFQQCFSP